jgi:DNA-binding helix-turn-helix protein
LGKNNAEIYVFNIWVMKNADNKGSIAERLRQARLHLHMKSKDFAAKAGFKNAGNYSEIETGRRNAGVDRLKRISKAHGISLSWLVYGEGDMMASASGNVTMKDIKGSLENIGAIGGTHNDNSVNISGVFGLKKIKHPDGQTEIIFDSTARENIPPEIKDFISEYNTLSSENKTLRETISAKDTIISQKDGIISQLQSIIDTLSK